MKIIRMTGDMPPCCCGPSVGCCCEVSAAIKLTISAPGCGFDGMTQTVETTDGDVADWQFDCVSGCEPADPEHCDSVTFDLDCVDGSYRLMLALHSEVEPTYLRCYGTLISCECDPMVAVFAFDCDFCCGDLTVTVEEVEESGV